MKRTPGHEAAHIIAWVVFGDRGHGWRWKMVARELGIADTRCHTYKVPPTVRRKRYPVYCGCDQNSATKVIVTRMKNGIRYRCRKCSYPLSLAPMFTAAADRADEKA